MSDTTPEHGATPTLDQLPIKVQRLVRRLRKDCSLYRLQRNEARAELTRVRNENVALQLELMLLTSRTLHTGRFSSDDPARGTAR
ncbi:MAG: hypothetical protein JST91_08625 [Actinobacteria bacterium]|nr:hypothetical protein [Actinomycetota bacterium]